MNRFLIPSLPRSSYLPLSLHEQHYFYNPGDDIIELCFRIKGNLDIVVLSHAFEKIIARHEILRTSYHHSEGGAFRKIQPPRPFSILRIPLPGLGDLAEDTRLIRARKEALSGLDLSKADLFQVILFSVDAEDHILLMLIHHIIFDGYSINLLLRELGELYTTVSKNPIPHLGSVALQYADVASWLLNTRDCDCHNQMERYLKADFSLPPVSVARADDSISSGFGPVFKIKRFELPSEAYSDLMLFSYREKASAFLILFSSVSLLLNKEFDVDDIAMLCPTAGQQRLGFSQLMGCLVDALVIRNRIDLSESFRGFLTRVRKQTLMAYSNHGFPLGPLQEALGRVYGWRPVLLNVMPIDELVLGDLEVMDLELPFEPPLGDEIADTLLSWTFYVKKNSLSARLDYNAKIFSDAFISKMISDFHDILGHAIKHPELAVNQLIGQ